MTRDRLLSVLLVLSAGCTDYTGLGDDVDSYTSACPTSSAAELAAALDAGAPLECAVQESGRDFRGAESACATLGFRLPTILEAQRIASRGATCTPTLRAPWSTWTSASAGPYRCAVDNSRSVYRLGGGEVNPVLCVR